MYCSLQKNNNIIGIFDNLDTCDNFLKGLKSNNMIKNFNDYKIKKFYKNTLNLINEYNYKNNELVKLNSNKKNDDNKKDNIKKNLTDEEIKKKKEILEKKRGIENKKRILNIKKERIESSKRVYKEDLKLYELFKTKINEKDFVIPELFQNKFNLMKILEEKGKLSWENFFINYKEEELESEYQALF
jgi:hypothetical protein